MSTEQPHPVLFAVADGIARITLNRPEKRNALNDAVIGALKDSLRRADQDEGVRAVILGGAGADFCSGADLAALQKISNASVAENLEDARSLMELFMLIRLVGIPVIAAVKGRALAGGCGLATACDIILAQRSARFGYPEVRLGFIPAMVMAMLRRSVSEKRAFELVTLGAEFSAEEAAEVPVEIVECGPLWEVLSAPKHAYSKRLIAAVGSLRSRGQGPALPPVGPD